MGQSVEVGDVWIAKDQSELEIEVFVVSGDTVVCKLTKDWGGYVRGELVTYTKDTLFRIYAKEVDKVYFDGYQEGYKFGHLDGKKEGYESGYADCSEKLHSIFGERELEIEKDAFQEGYAQAYSELHAPTTERERQLQEKAWDEGYVSAIEDYLAQGGEFIGNVGCYEFGAVEGTEDEQLEKELALVEKYPHYYKDVRHLNILDIYRFFDLFEVTDSCIQHSTKKLAVGGKRGSKDYEKDIKEAMDTLKRWEYMQEENKRGLDD